MTQALFSILDFEIGDEVWWFKITIDNYSQLYHHGLNPSQIELVHDTVKEIKGEYLYCWHTAKKPHEVWGKSRKEAWKTLKDNIEKWGKLDD